MTDYARLLTDLETCPRKGYLGRTWERNKLSSKDMLSQGIRAGLVAPVSSGEQGSSFGEVSGSEILQLAADRGLDTDQRDVYASVIHLAALSDILVSAIRKPNDPEWLQTPTSHFSPSNEGAKEEVVQNWTSGCFVSPDGLNLRRVALVSHWNDSRHYAECKNWATLGPIVHHNLPLQIVVLVIGQYKGGKYHSPWTQGFLHPANHQLRFRKRSAGFRQTGNVFNDKWTKIWREDHDEIKRETWLQSMLTDDILRDVCFKVDVPVPEEPMCQKIRDMAARKLERLAAMKEIPEPQLSGCEWPMPCPFRFGCHSIPERLPSLKNGFVRVEALRSDPVAVTL